MATLQLDSHERAILDRQLNGLETDGKKSNHVFVYATFLDKVILSISSLCAVIAGALNPLVPVGDTRRRLFFIFPSLIIHSRSSTVFLLVYSMASPPAMLLPTSCGPRYQPSASTTSISPSHSSASRMYSLLASTTLESASLGRYELHTCRQSCARIWPSLTYSDRGK